MAERYWDLFIEKIAELLSRVLTDTETERLLRTLPENSFSEHLRRHSSNNLARLQEEAERLRPFCRHKGPCTHNCIRGFIKTFIAAYIVKYAVNVLPSLLTGKAFKKPRILVKSAGLDTIRFAAFLASFVGGFKGINCLMRKLRGKEDAYNSLVAGTLAGTALFLDEKSRRISVALYLSTRALEFAYISLMRRGYLPNIPHGDALVMALSSAQILNAYLLEPQSLAKSYMAFLLEHGGMNKHGPHGRTYLADIGRLVKGGEAALDRCVLDHAHHHVTAASSGKVDLSLYGHVFKDYPRGGLDYLVTAAPVTEILHAMEHPRTVNCEIGSAQFFLDSIPRSVKLYLPLNLVMSLIFRYKQIVARPDQFILRTLQSTARSTLFLSLYCTTAWYVPCWVRRLTGREPPLAYYINGFCSGLCVLVEQKSRRLELAMYCAPRALESLWNCLVKWGWARDIPSGEVLYFAGAMGALMAIYQHDKEALRGGYLNVMTRVFGEN